jgi:DNA polymerase III epsilon subunit-like protein
MQIPHQKQGIYAVADLETTGLLPGYHGIVQVCIVVTDSNFEVLDTLNMDVNPPDSYIIDPEALKFNGMTMDQIKLGISYPEAATQILSFLDKYFNESPTWIGQFFPFDFAGLLDMMIKTHNNDGFLKFFSNKFLDTKVIAGYLNLKAQKEQKPLPFPTSLSLSKIGGLKDTLNVSQIDFPAHTALGDVMATKEVLKKLISLNS